MAALNRAAEDDTPEIQEKHGQTLRISKKVIHTESELIESMSFSRALVDEIGISASLINQICPVEVAQGSKQCVLLVSSRLVRSANEIEEVLLMMLKKNFRMSEGAGPNVFISENDTLIMNVSRGQITGEDVTKRKRLMAKETPEGALYKSFEDIIVWAVAQNASDVHLNLQNGVDRSEVRFTIDGKYVAPERFRMPTKMLEKMAAVAYQISKGGNGANFSGQNEQQCRIFMDLGQTRGGQVMLRWASMATDDGPQITLRILRLDAQQQDITLEGLGYLPSHIAMFERAMTSEGGAIVMAGVVGSGKSTTLAQLMRTIPRTRKVMTLEDPREYIIPGAHQNTISRSMEKDDNTAFLAKLRTLKRTAFNDLLVGEIRDKPTGEAFQDVVESGHNVYTTVHARRHIGIPDRLASPFIGVAREVLSTPGILKLLVYQALLPKSCPECAMSIGSFLQDGASNAAYWTVYFKRIQRLFEIDLSRITLRNEAGCSRCIRPDLPGLAGYRGRTVVAEMIEPDELFLEYVRDAKNIELENYASSLRESPMHSPDMVGKSALECAVYKMSLGMIDPREIEPRFEAFETMENKQMAKERARATRRRQEATAAPNTPAERDVAQTMAVTEVAQRAA